jgi:hypothetical protein
MAKKKLITLAREMERETESEYFDYLISSFYNGGLSQCRRLFNEMKKSDQKAFVTYCKDNEYFHVFDYYFNLL